LKLKNGDLRSQGGSEALNFATLFQDKVEENANINVAYKTNVNLRFTHATNSQHYFF
jgi:hypothetical protein